MDEANKEWKNRESIYYNIPKLYSILKGEVTSMEEYGVFVRIPGLVRNGMVHRSQMANKFVENPDKHIEIGEFVWVKVVYIEEGGTRIGLSMKVVDQETGADLDPSHSVSQNDDAKRVRQIMMHRVDLSHLDKIRANPEVSYDMIGENKYELAATSSSIITNKKEAGTSRWHSNYDPIKRQKEKERKRASKGHWFFRDDDRNSAKQQKTIIEGENKVVSVEVKEWKAPKKKKKKKRR